MITVYKGYQITYEEINGKIIVTRAYYCGIQCSYGATFESMSALERFIDSGGWSVGSGTR